MATMNVPVHWEDAKLAIDRHRQLDSRDDPTAEALKGWPQDERDTFIRWWAEQVKQARERDIATQMAKPPMTQQESIQAIKDIDFKRGETIDNFVVQTQIRDHEPYPEPLILGQEGDFLYMLWSEGFDPNPRRWHEPEIRVHDFIFELYRQKNGTYSPRGCPLRYILPLGPLVCLTSEDLTSEPVDTLFYLVLNIVDKSLWMVLHNQTYDGNGLEIPIPEGTNPWDSLPTAADERPRPAFDVMQVMSWEELSSLTRESGRERQMFGTTALGTAKRIHHQVRYAAADEIAAALEA